MLRIQTSRGSAIRKIITGRLSDRWIGLPSEKKREPGYNYRADPVVIGLEASWEHDLSFRTDDEIIEILKAEAYKGITAISIEFLGITVVETRIFCPKEFPRCHFPEQTHI